MAPPSLAPPPKAEPDFDIVKCLSENGEFCMHKLFWPNGPPPGGYPDFVARPQQTGPGFQSLHIDYGDLPGSKLAAPDPSKLPEASAPGCINVLNRTDLTKLTAGEVANAEAIGKALGMSEKCVQATKEYFQQDISDPNAWSFASFLGVPHDRSRTDSFMNSEGCGDFFSSLQNVYSSMARMRCQFTNIKNESEIRSVNSSNITVRVRGATPETARLIVKIQEDYQKQISDYRREERPSLSEQAALYRESPELYNAIMASYEQGLLDLQRALEHYTDEHPIEGNMIGSTISISQKMRSEVVIMDDISPEENADIKTEIETLASESAIQKIQEEIGLGALPPNARAFVEQNSKQISEEQIDQTMSIINQNKMKVDNKGGIIIEVYGSMLGSTIILSTESEIDVKVQTSIASAISLAEQVTSRVVSGLKVERHLIYKGEGVTDVWGKIISGATERFGITAITDTVYWIAIAIVIAVFAYFAIGF
jgi:hypothetical protein